MKTIGAMLACIIGPLIMGAFLLAIGTGIFSFIFMDISYFGNVIEFFNPISHIWVRVVLIIYVLLAGYVGAALSNFG